MKIRENQFYLCNTYMQLITAIQIKKYIYPNEKGKLLLSDHSVNADKVIQRMTSLGIFDDVIAADTKFYEFEQSKYEDFKDVMTLTLGLKNKYSREFLCSDCIYDRIFFHNYDFILYPLLEQCWNRGKVPALCRMEEGISSYANMIRKELETPSTRMKAIHKLRGFFKKPTLDGNMHDFFVFFPTLFPPTEKKVHGIPLLSCEDKDLVNIFDTIFDYHPEKDPYPEKYIFMGSCRNIDGASTRETEIILKLAELVGPENLLVKMHPRDGRHVYEEKGIHVSRNSSVPWEVIQLSHDFSNHVILTVSSSSAITASALLCDNVETFLLYPMDTGLDNEYDKFCEESLGGLLKKLQLQGLCLNHHVTGNLEDIVNVEDKH